MSSAVWLVMLSFFAILVSGDYFSFERQFGGGLFEYGDGLSIPHPVHLKEHAAGPHLHLVAYRVALALAELYFRRLLGKRFVGGDAHPLLAGLAKRAGDD